MDNETQKLINNQLSSLPISVKKALSELPWKNTVKELAVSNSLNPEQAEILERETLFILYGFENPLDYPENLTRELGIDEETASNIALEVSEKILTPLEDKIKELESQQTNVAAPITPATPTTPIQPLNNLPMVEKGEVAHEVPHVEVKSAEPIIPIKVDVPEAKPVINPTKPHYPDGQDPYREPIA